MLRLRVGLLALVACSSPATTIDAGADAAPPIPLLSDSVSVTDITVYQAVKAPLLQAGTRLDSPSVPVIAGRSAMVRVNIGIADGSSKLLEAELHIVDAGKETAVLRDKKRIVFPADDGAFATSFNFLVEANVLGPDTQFFIRLDDPAYPNRSEAVVRYPADETVNDTFGAQTDSAELKLQFVPIRYDADGSQRVPDTSPTGLQPFEDTLYRMYPTAKITAKVHAPYPWNQKIEADGTGWDELLMAMFELRYAESTPGDVYTVVMFAPAPTFELFCANGCIAGVGLGEGAKDPLARIAMIAGYTSDFMTGTLNQELAHSMGRDHAPCGGPDGIDPKFPYKDGSIGKWGYDISARKLLNPFEFDDFMSYCQPVFVSDYTYAALYRQMSYVTRTTPMKSVRPGRYRIVHQSKKGTRIGKIVELPIAADGPERAVRIFARGRTDVVRVPSLVLPELRSEILFVPESTAFERIAAD